jgi:hypothetical protein
MMQDNAFDLETIRCERDPMRDQEKTPKGYNKNAEIIPNLQRDHAILSYVPGVYSTQPLLKLRAKDWQFLLERFSAHDPETTAQADRFTRALDDLHHHIAQTEKRDVFLFGPELYRALDFFDSPALFARIPTTDWSIVFDDCSFAEVSWSYCPGVFFEHATIPYQHIGIDLETLAGHLSLFDHERDTGYFHTNLAFLRKYGNAVDLERNSDDRFLKDTKAAWDRFEKTKEYYRDNPKEYFPFRKSETPEEAVALCRTDPKAWTYLFCEVYNTSEMHFALGEITTKIDDPDDDALHLFPPYLDAPEGAAQEFRDLLDSLGPKEGSEFEPQSVNLCYRTVSDESLNGGVDIPEVRDAIDHLIAAFDDENAAAIKAAEKMIEDAGWFNNPMQEAYQKLEVFTEDPSCLSDIAEPIMRLHKALGGRFQAGTRKEPDVFMEHDNVLEWHADGCMPEPPMGAFCGIEDDTYLDEGESKIDVWFEVAIPASSHKRLLWRADLDRKVEALIKGWEDQAKAEAADKALRHAQRQAELEV